MQTFSATPKDIIVIHDDSDIVVGTFRLVNDGRSAGHKGIQSIIDHLHTEDFARVRIGIREKDEIHRKKAGAFVLSPITAKDKKAFQEVFTEIAQTIASLLLKS
jgi:PTH1 family peptidyl-tRNA hydrolase